jgi:hypothetical protein
MPRIIEAWIKVDDDPVISSDVEDMITVLKPAKV